MMLGTSFPNFANAMTEINEFSDMNQVENEVNKYVVSEGKEVTFNMEQAILDGQSDFILSIGENINTINSAYKNTVSTSNDVMMIPELSLPIWGNWCGPGHGGGQPKDLLDYSCMLHDKDYAKYGYFDCGSDRRLIANINLHYKNMGAVEKGVALAVKAYFQAQMLVNRC